MKRLLIELDEESICAGRITELEDALIELMSHLGIGSSGLVLYDAQLGAERLFEIGKIAGLQPNSEALEVWGTSWLKRQGREGGKE